MEEYESESTESTGERGELREYRGFRVPNAMIDAGVMNGLSEPELRVLLIFMRFTNNQAGNANRGNAWPGPAAIAKLLPAKPGAKEKNRIRYVKRIIKSLIDKGLLDTVDARGGRDGDTAIRRVNVGPRGRADHPVDHATTPPMDPQATPPAVAQTTPPRGLADHPKRRIGKDNEKEKRKVLFDWASPESGVRNEIQHDLKGLVIPPELRTPDFIRAWGEWKDHVAENGRKLTHTAAKKRLDELRAWGPERAVKAIEHSICNVWKTIYEPRGVGSTEAAEIEGFKEREVTEEDRASFPSAEEIADWGKDTALKTAA
jgi:hypothetical protein